jgi:hypothetical protein
MAARMPDELRTMVAASPNVPVELLDEKNHRTYVLIPTEEFERLKGASPNDLAESYPAQVESAMRAGWSDPLMDEYNDYDSHRGRA